MGSLPVSLSASKLKQFDHCPEAFRLGYIEDYREEGGENKYIRRGNAVHDALEDVLTERPDVNDRDGLAFALKRAYWDNGGKSGYDLSADGDDMVQDCLDTAAKYISKQVESIVAVESEIPFHDESVDHDFTGYVDLVTERSVVDWKTGSSDGKETDEVLQGAVYMCGYLKHMGRLPESVVFVYLKEGKVRTLDAEKRDEMYDRMTEVAGQLLDAVDREWFPAKPDDSRCYWCDYEVHCHASPVGGGGIDWESYP